VTQVAAVDAAARVARPDASVVVASKLAAQDRRMPAVQDHQAGETVLIDLAVLELWPSVARCHHPGEPVAIHLASLEARGSAVTGGDAAAVVLVDLTRPHLSASPA